MPLGGYVLMTYAIAPWQMLIVFVTGCGVLVQIYLGFVKLEVSFGADKSKYLTLVVAIAVGAAVAMLALFAIPLSVNLKLYQHETQQMAHQAEQWKALEAEKEFQIALEAQRSAGIKEKAVSTCAYGAYGAYA